MSTTSIEKVNMITYFENLPLECMFFIFLTDMIDLSKFTSNKKDIE